jgi:hypothetical protein
VLYFWFLSGTTVRSTATRSLKFGGVFFSPLLRDRASFGAPLFRLYFELFTCHWPELTVIVCFVAGKWTAYLMIQRNAPCLYCVRHIQGVLYLTQRKYWTYVCCHNSKKLLSHIYCCMYIKYVCVCVCMYVCMYITYVCMYVCMCVYACVCMYVCVYACMCVFMCVRMYECVCVCVCVCSTEEQLYLVCKLIFCCKLTYWNLHCAMNIRISQFLKLKAYFVTVFKRDSTRYL